MSSYALPPPSWKGWRALLLMLTAPLLYKTTAALTVIVSTLLFGGGVSAERRYEGLIGAWSDHDARITVFCDSGNKLVWTTLSVANIVVLYATVVAKLLLLGARQYDLCRCHVIQEITIQYSTHPCFEKRTMPHKRDHVTISKLLTAVAAVVLLLSAKEVETNAAGPPPDSTTCDRWSHLHTCLMCCEGAIAHNIIHFEKNQCIQPPDNTAVTKHFMFFTRRQPHVSSLMSHNYAVVVLKLLMLSGDVETNPGPPGAQLTVKTTCSMIYDVRAKWKNIGIQLEMDLGTLNAIEKRHRSDPDDCLPEMLDYWLKQVSPRPSWNSLAEALESKPIGEGHLAEQIREKYCTEAQLQGHVTGDFHHSGSHTITTHLEADDKTDRQAFGNTSTVTVTHGHQTQLLYVAVTSRKYHAYLKALYSGSTHVSDNKWPPTPFTKYVNLFCVSGQAGSNCKTLITIDQVACKVKDYFTMSGTLSYPRIVLVTGAPGVGKTTFAWELCRRWAKGELLQDYSLVVLLRLRDKSAREAKELVDLFPYPKRSISEAAVDEALERSGSGILMILEGFDELPEAMRSKPSIYHDLINGKLLPHATVLVTSRPWAVGDFQWQYYARISQWIEILGFTGQQIDEYVVSYSNEDHKLLAELRRYLSLNPPIHAAMYIPLNAVIVCELYKEKQKRREGVIPSTMTELYTIFSRNLLLRYLFDQDEGPGMRRLKKFEDLPVKVYHKFLALCELAYKGIVNKQQLVFSDLPDDFDSLGFMKSVEELHISSGMSVSYNFLHLTMQEFLAAYHLSLHPECTQHLSTNSMESSTVTKFLAGITQLHSAYFEQHLSKLNPEQTVNIEVARVSQMKRTYVAKVQTGPIACWAEVNIVTLSSSMVNYYTGKKCSAFSNSYSSWFYESQNVQKLDECLGAKTTLIQITSDMTPMDCFAAGWCIGNSSCQWILCFYSDVQLSLDCMQMLHAGIRHSSSQQKRKICDVCIGEGVMNSDPDTVREIFDLLGSTFDVMKLSYTCSCYRRMHTKHSQYTYLSTVMKKLSKHLKEVEIVSVKFPNACVVMQTIFAVAETLPLEALLLKYSKLHNSTIDVIKKMSSLKVLDLSGSNFTQTHPARIECGQLAEVLKTNKTLQTLILYKCGFSQKETTALFHVFTESQNTTLQMLNVSDNDYCMKHLEEMLVSNTSLQHVEVTVTFVNNPRFGRHFFREGRHEFHYQAEDQENTRTKFNSTPGMVAYVGREETPDSVCKRIVLALTRNSTLKQLVINTLFSEWLKETLATCQDYGKVKDKIKITQSKNPIYY